MSKSSAIAAAIGVFFAIEASALSVIPNGVGYGMTTPAGRGGQVYRVTNLNSSGAGSLKACIDASGPRVCVFEVSGTIRLTDITSITNPFITIAGQTAPSPGITLRGNKLRIATSDVLIQHLRIRSGDGPGLTALDTSGPMTISNNSSSFRNVVIDHVSLSWALDENLDMDNGFQDVTIRNSILSEALYDSLHPKGPHSMAALMAENGNSVAMISNLLAHNRGRNPRSLVRNFVFANNIVYDYGQIGLDMTLASDGMPLHHTVVGNIFMQGQSSNDIRPITLRSKTGGSAGASSIYLADNRSMDHTVSNQWQLVDNELSSTPSASSPQSWVDGLAVVSAVTQTQALLDATLDNVGARPADRDSVDKRIVSQTRARTGEIINCVAADGSARCAKNAGGWPVLAENHRPLTLPANPNGDNDGDGYTNLEEWLHQMAAEVEGDSSTRPSPPSLVRVE